MKRLALGFLWVILGLYVAAIAGCAGFSASRETCIGAVDTRQEAAKLVVPHLANALVCAADNDTDEAVMMCVEKEFALLKTQAKPIVYACALAMVGDVVAAGKK